MTVTAREREPGKVLSIGVSRDIGRKRLLSALSAIDGLEILGTAGLISRILERPACDFAFRGQRYSVQAEWPAFDSYEIIPVPSGFKHQTSELFFELRCRLEPEC